MKIRLVAVVLTVFLALDVGFALAQNKTHERTQVSPAPQEELTIIGWLCVSPRLYCVMIVVDELGGKFWLVLRGISREELIREFSVGERILLLPESKSRFRLLLNRGERSSFCCAEAL
jgi:hypothetical protein